jgi:hypothetical protein
MALIEALRVRTGTAAVIGEITAGRAGQIEVVV